jgi:hypothetical protein
MNLSPDPRQLKTRVTLSVMNAPESGFFSGDYTAASATKGLDNLNVLNYDFNSVYEYEDGTSEPKYSSRLQTISALQNARIPEVNTTISASSCTFALGGIVPGETDPIIDRLRGPDYVVNFIDNPNQGSVSSPGENYTDLNLHVPKIPFTKEGNVLTTYNIWNIINGTTDAYKYIGPKTSSSNTGTLRTVKDPTYGSQVEVTSYNTETSIIRIFPTSQDAVYQDGAEVYNPDGTKEKILARGNYGNNSFHINLSATNLQTDKSSIRIVLEPPLPYSKDYINHFKIILQLDKKPTIQIFDPDTLEYITQSDISGPVFDKNNCTSFDIYVHFVGPNLLIGFTPDISRWNAIIGFAGREVFCPDNSFVMMGISNANVKFRYSALIFNNFNNNQPAGFRKNYMVGEFKYSKSKIPDAAKLLNETKKSFDKASYRINDNPRSNGYNLLNPKDKNISYFADLRLRSDYPQYSQFVSPLPYKFSRFKSADTDKVTLYFKMTYNTTIEGPALLQVEMPHPGVLGSAGAANVGSISGSDYKFIDPDLTQLFYDVGDITWWVENWSITCSSSLANLSRINKAATITLKNIDSRDGQAYIDAIENNLICVSIDAGYIEGNLKSFFQGFITNTTYSRRGNDSTLTLTCTDIASFILDNIYFDKNMMIGGMRHDFAIDSMIACSGFWSFYRPFPAGIDGLDLRLNSSSVNNQDLIKLNPLDKIYTKLGQLLERLNTPEALPTFRWAERYGLVLESRNNNIDKDLKFTGLNAAGNQYIMNSNASNQKNYMENFQSDLHGLLVSDYRIKTDMNTLSAGLRAFGSSITGFLADERYFPDAVSIENLSTRDKVDLLKYLSGAATNPAQSPYVGFKKYQINSFQRNQIPDQTVLTNITNQLQKVARTPISRIEFDCYVTKPLSFHGKFIINVFSGNPVNSTDQYIYESLSYQYNKGENYISASVQGINIPILLKD